MAERLPEGAFHQFVPLDHPGYCARFLDHWRPDLGVWVESEFWPNLIVEADRRGLPLALVNARITERSFRSWQRAPRFIAGLLARFRLLMAQDAASAARLRALGAGDVSEPGNLKPLSLIHICRSRRPTLSIAPGAPSPQTQPTSTPPHTPSL